MTPIPGALYKYKYAIYDAYNGYNNTVRTGIFLRQKTYRDYEGKFWVFKNNRYTESSLVAHHVSYMMDTSPTLAKQVARGLCDRIPEDCAGIIERMLVGDSIVGKRPDRYPERS